MSKKVSLIIVLAAAAVFLLAACERSASNSPLATATSEGSGLVSLPTGISLVEAWGTSTAIYQQTANSLLTASPTPTGSTSDAEATPTVETTPVIVVPTSTPGRPATYTLEKGEFPYCIARRFDVDPANMLALSGVNQGQILLPGLELKIPQTGSFPGERALHSHPTTYTVSVNDTLHSIACYFGDIDPTSIAAANGLSLDSPLTSGKILNIP
ncbi:MAG: LysM peptidoglycan-binding domain-containing protein [Chloroflexota bacterium]